LYVDVSIKYWLSTFFREKPYTCIDCDKKYCHKKDLVAHKNAAHGMSEFRWKECSSVFGYETALKRHVRSKHEGKRCVCSVCKNTFTYRANYVRHLKMKHRDVNWKCRVFTNTLRLVIDKKHLKAIKVFLHFLFSFSG
jgi:KRAB domain-containing zinc finger protein